MNVTIGLTSLANPCTPAGLPSRNTSSVETSSCTESPDFSNRLTPERERIHFTAELSKYALPSFLASTGSTRSKKLLPTASSRVDSRSLARMPGSPLSIHRPSRACTSGPARSQIARGTHPAHRESNLVCAHSPATTTTAQDSRARAYSDGDSVRHLKDCGLEMSSSGCDLYGARKCASSFAICIIL